MEGGERWGVRETDSISGQRRSWVPGKVVQLSPALAKLTEVGFLIEVRKASGMMLTGVSGGGVSEEGLEEMGGRERMYWSSMRRAAAGRPRG